MQMKFARFNTTKPIILMAVLSCLAGAGAKAQTSDTIGYGTSATNSYGPVRVATTASSSFSTKTISLFTQSELAAIGIFPGAVIDSIAWQKSTNGILTNGSSDTLKVRLRDQVNTTSYTGPLAAVLIDNYTATGFVTTGTRTFSASGNNFPADTSWVYVAFPTPFTYAGGSLEVLMHNVFVIGMGTPNAPASANLTWRITSGTATSCIYTNNTPAYNNTANCNSGTIRPNTIFHYTAGPACNGTPSAGTISLDTVRACPGMLSGNLRLNNTSAATGITLQWEQQPDGQTGFTPIAGAVNYNLASQSITVPTAYRAIVTCGLLSDTTPVFTMAPTVNIQPNYLQDFTTTGTWIGASAPGCWENRRGLMDEPVTFTTNAQGAYNAGFWANGSWAATGTAGTGAARLQLSSSNFEWLLSPVINLGAGAWQVDFDMGIFKYNAASQAVMGADDIVAIVISTDGGATFNESNILQKWDNVTPFPANEPNGLHFSIPLTSYSGPVVLGFYGTGGATNPVSPQLAPNVMIDNFQILPAGTVLPVSIDQLTARLDPQGNGLLSWKTYTEENNAGFVIEKSTDGKSFAYTGSVASMAKDGNSHATLSYTYTDRQHNNVKQYYRLKQTDRDGKTAYSNIVSLEFGQAVRSHMKVYPNPAGNIINISFTESNMAGGTITVTDLVGHTLITQAVTAGITPVNISTLQPGVYFVNYAGTWGITVQKIVKH